MKNACHVCVWLVKSLCSHQFHQTLSVTLQHKAALCVHSLPILGSRSLETHMVSGIFADFDVINRFQVINIWNDTIQIILAHSLGKVPVYVMMHTEILPVIFDLKKITLMPFQIPHIINSGGILKRRADKINNLLPHCLQAVSHKTKMVAIPRLSSCLRTGGLQHMLCINDARKDTCLCESHLDLLSERQREDIAAKYVHHVWVLQIGEPFTFDDGQVHAHITFSTTWVQWQAWSACLSQMFVMSQSSQSYSIMNWNACDGDQVNQDTKPSCLNTCHSTYLLHHTLL